MLEVSDLSASYGVIPALHGVSFNIRESEIVTILGSNGTGKSTILNVVQGMMPGSGGRIIFRDEAIHGLPSHKVVARGIVQVPEGMKSFPFMTVKENF
jgi:branched-chain amino acid transport system ATP-binding protein